MPLPSAITSVDGIEAEVPGISHKTTLNYVTYRFCSKHDNFTMFFYLCITF